ncbi:ROK family protein [uncultured Fusobacterium sp.]|uniref:ROK family protein n=1 Tax=uncultured Fusobacterium sp. TaxID=159267 RepID=UPI0027DD043A|nr:ROK family protein [uncultured Fusobacterium sp.]
MKDVIYQKKEKMKNINRVYQFISQNKFFTKKEIADSLDISFPTVAKIINLLLDKKIVIDKGYSDNNIKRKASLYEYNPNSFYSIGIKIELSSVSFILINLNGDEIKKTVIIKNFFNDENFVFYIMEELKLFLKNFPYQNLITGIGISLSGIVDNKSKILKIGTNFNLFEKNMEIIENTFSLPIYLINEANAGAVGEFFLNRTLKEQNIVFISIDSGVGAGIVIDGNLYKGHSSKAGEFGHFTVENHGKKCNCGNEGCLEMYCSNRALIKAFEEEFNLSNLSFIEIFSKNLADTENGRRILEKYTDYLASGIRNLLFLLDLDRVIIGGLISNYSHYIKDPLEKKVFNNIFLEDKSILEFSKYGDFSNLIGAAFLPFNDLFIHLF